MRYVALILLLVLSGCGGRSGSAPDSAAAGDSDPRPSAAATASESTAAMASANFNTPATVAQEIAAAWSGVRILVVDRESGAEETFEIPIERRRSVWATAGSSFRPVSSFRTSSSTKTASPAVRRSPSTPRSGSSSPRMGWRTSRAGSSPRCRKSARTLTPATRCFWSRAFLPDRAVKQRGRRAVPVVVRTRSLYSNLSRLANRVPLRTRCLNLLVMARSPRVANLPRPSPYIIGSAAPRKASKSSS